MQPSKPFANQLSSNAMAKIESHAQKTVKYPNLKIIES
jgi:hypothetical protein